MGELDEAMCEAIALGERAGKQGDVPVGAVVLDERGTVIGRGRNRREAGHDPLAHAEIEAMREAAQARGDWNLADCTLVVTLEPCPMCAGACIQTRIGRIVFGAWDAKLGACGSIWDIPRDPHVGHVPQDRYAGYFFPCARNTRYRGNKLRFVYHRDRHTSDARRRREPRNEADL